MTAVEDDIRALLRGHGRTVEALRKTQGEQIGELRAEMRAGFTKVNLGIKQIIGLIKDVERG
jgi:hypothetical protein